MSDSENVILEAEGVTKTFPGVRALDAAGLTLSRGRLTAHLGENAAGYVDTNE